jgi:uncharacterized membrane protein YkgB
MTSLIRALAKSGLLRDGVDYHLVRASMVLIFLLFGYQKWFEYEAQVLIPFIRNGPLISWMCPAFGIRGASWFLGVAEWATGALLFLGFWDKRLGVLGALGACATFVGTVTIIPFMPDGWAASAGGFPAMTGNIPLPDEGCGSLRRILLSAEAGRRACRRFAQHGRGARRESSGGGSRLLSLAGRSRTAAHCLPDRVTGVRILAQMAHL